MNIDVQETLLRVGMAFLTGFVLGLERESHGRPAGLRTMVLVCVAAAIATILSDHFYTGSFAGEHRSETWHPDPARLAAGILTGIGFLGAGVIINQRNAVRGVTTASQIWFVTILGLCYGAGQLLLGFIGAVVSFITVYYLRKLELFLPSETYAVLRVSKAIDGPSVEEISSAICKMKVHLEVTKLLEDIPHQTAEVTFALRFRKIAKSEIPEQVLKALGALPGIRHLEWK